MDPLSCYAISVFTTAFFFIKIPDRTRRGNEIEESRHTLLRKSRVTLFICKICRAYLVDSEILFAYFDQAFFEACIYQLFIVNRVKEEKICCMFNDKDELSLIIWNV